MSVSSGEEWSRAYAIQAQTDFTARDTLCRERNLPPCQQLHFLQMGCEKLCKAHLCARGSKPDDLQTSHAYIAKNLPLIAEMQYIKACNKPLQGQVWFMPDFRNLAREIELLAPAVDDNKRRPDNCKYPWQDAKGLVIIPAEYPFSRCGALQEQPGRLFLKLLMMANAELLK
jgi:hypothetical protein